MKKYLESKGVKVNHDELLLEGLKTGNIQIDGVDLTALNKVLTAIKQMEKTVVGEVEKIVPGWQRLNEHAFAASTNKWKVAAMTKREFINGFTMNGDGSGGWLIKFKKHVPDEQMGEIIAGIYTSTRSVKDIFAKGVNRMDGILENRGFSFTSNEAELLWWKRFGETNKGLLGGKLDHLRRLHKSAITSQEIGHLPKEWYDSLYTVTRDRLKNSVDQSELKTLFKDAKNVIDNALGHSTYDTELMSIVVQLSHDILQAGLLAFFGGEKYFSG